MEAVAKALLTAKEEVFITDWWLSPEILMIRPSDDESYRLDLILGKIAVISSDFQNCDRSFIEKYKNRIKACVSISWFTKK